MTRLFSPRPLARFLALSLSFAALAQQPPVNLPGLTYDKPFFPGAQYNPNIPTPDSVLGFPAGQKPATHAQIEAVVKALANNNPRCKLFEYGKTHEGRTLYYLVITAPKHIERLDAIKQDLAKLADPRSVSAADADRIADSIPAVAWMAYVIHGDEMSSSDAALAVAHHLAAGTDASVTSMLDDLIVIIDPLMNPDGRDRWLNIMRTNRTAQPQVDDQSLLHTGNWPSGRMNHYLFDMNRDWIFATQPETRGRIKAISEWNPHYLVEGHEMGSQDTFLFQPARDPHNPNADPNAAKWADEFAKDQAAAFDQFGWRYYTGEWNEEWYPGYTGSWAGLRGITNNLYEQANIQSDAVRRPEGTLETYREAVHHQLVATMANLTTLQKNRKAIVKGTLEERRKNVSADGPYAARCFAVVPGANESRWRQFMDLLQIQGFEAYSLDRDFTADGKDRLGLEFKGKAFPKGTLFIPTRQPLARLIAAMMEFDPRMSEKFLADERRELLRFGGSKLYDITGWNIPMLFDVDASELAIGLPEGAKRLSEPPAAAGVGVTNPDAKVAFAIDGADDKSVAAAARLMEHEVWCRVATKPFKLDGKEFPRGSVLVLRKDNTTFKGDLAKTIDEVVKPLRLSAVGIGQGLGDGDLPDLGGGYFQLLQPPRIAVVGREPFSAYGYGQAWYMLDHVLGVRASYIDVNVLGGGDLRRYNVIVLPDTWGEFPKDKIDALRTWAQAGGTIIAIGGSAKALAKDKEGIGSARLVSDILGKMDDYRQGIIREWEGLNASPKLEDVWSHVPPKEVVYPWRLDEGEKSSEEEAKRRDGWRAMFMPQGVVLAARVDDRSWLTAGCGEYLPVLYGGGVVLHTPAGVPAPVRFGVFNPAPPEVKKEEEKSSNAKGAKDAKEEKAEDKKSEDKKDEKKEDKKEEKKPAPGWQIAPPGQELRLRMAGLLWPEASERLANSAFVTREGVGNGQVILFAADPNFRAATLGMSRVFSNAVVYGPGLGASQTIKP